MLFPVLHKWLLALALANAQSPDVSLAECVTVAEPFSDLHEECFCALETWRCMAQGWCGPYEPLGLPTYTAEGC
jgi:hypothetical protein